MATALSPVLDSVTAVPATVAEGGTTVITVKAHDPNGRSVTVSGTISVDGQSGPFSIAVPVGAGTVVVSGWAVSDPENIATITANADGVSATLKV